MAGNAAIIEVGKVGAANAALEAEGFGHGNFSIPLYTNGDVSHMTMHSWPYPGFFEAIVALGYATISEDQPGETPEQHIAKAAAAVGATTTPPEEST